MRFPINRILYHRLTTTMHYHIWKNEMGQGARGLFFRNILIRKCMDIPWAEGTIFFFRACIKTSTDSDWIWFKVSNMHLKYAPGSAWWWSNDGRGCDWLGNACSTSNSHRVKFFHALNLILRFLWFLKLLHINNFWGPDSLLLKQGTRSNEK